MSLYIGLESVPKIKGLDCFEVYELSSKLYVLGHLNYDSISNALPYSIKKHIKKKGYGQDERYSLTENVLSWYNQNHILNWFTLNIVDAGESNECLYKLNKQNLTNLLIDCETVIMNRDSDDALYIAKKLFPTSIRYSDSTMYDDCYYDTLKQSSRFLKELLKEFEFDKNDLVYQLILKR